MFFFITGIYITRKYYNIWASGTKIIFSQNIITRKKNKIIFYQVSIYEEFTNFLFDKK